MFNRLQLREIIAWMALALAFILFSVTIAFAQTKNVNTEIENGNVHISISNTQNGITHNFDTSFVLTDEADIEKIIIDKGKLEQLSAETDKISKEIEISIRNLNDCLENLNEKLKCDIIYLNKDDDGSIKDLEFLFSDSSMFDSEHIKKFIKNYKIDDDFKDHLSKSRVIIIDNGKNINLNDEDIVFAKKGNKVVIKNYSQKNTEQRNKKEDIKTEENDNIPGVRSFKYYPNPTAGNFKVSFNVENKCDVLVEIMDVAGKVVFKNRSRNFEGKYTEEFNLEDSDDGSYILKVTVGENSMSRKIILKKN